VVGHPEGNTDDYGHPVYYSRILDPTYTVRCTRWREACEVDGMDVRIPAGARPASGTDAHMAVVDSRRRWEYDFWQVQTDPLPPYGGRIVVSHGGRTRWGTDDADGLESHATASHFALAAGVIRAEEWEAATSSGGSIEHALFAGVRCTSGRSVYPAVPGTTGAVCARNRERETAPALGGRYYLDLSPERIDALPVPEWKKPILKAIARYGMIVGDTFGGDAHSFGIWAESDTQYTSLGEPGRYAAFGRTWGVPQYQGAYYFDIASGVNWRRYLRVVRPCVSSRDCG
jgi:hypothetical protein